MNKTSLSENSIEMLDQKIEEPKEQEVAPNQDTDKSSTSSTKIVLQIANISYLWFATIFVYYGLNINAVYLEYFSKYVSYIVSLLSITRPTKSLVFPLISDRLPH
jgi:hypothetical protein